MTRRRNTKPRPAAGWTDRAACLGQEPARWVPPTPTAQAAHLARTYCTHCPVIDQCRAEGAASRSEGIWAGEWWPSQRQGKPVDLLTMQTRKEAAA